MTEPTKNILFREINAGRIVSYLMLLVLVGFLISISIPAFLGQREKVAFRSQEAMIKAEKMRQALSAKDSAPLLSLLGSDAEAATPQQNSMLIKTGKFSLNVKDINTAIRNITDITNKLGGLVFSTDTHFWDRHESGTVVIRVPADAFDGAMASIRDVALKVVNESVAIEDVSEQYIDLEARLNNKKAEEVSFRSLLSRSGKMEDIISVTRELNRVRGEIESMQGKLNYLRNQIALSTITVDLMTEVPVGSDEWDVIKTIKSSFAALVNGIKYFIRLVIKIVFLAPVVLLYVGLAGGAYLVCARIYRGIVKRRGSAKIQED